MPAQPDISRADLDHIAKLLASMSLPEKAAQLAGLWLAFEPSTGAMVTNPGTFIASRTEEPPVEEQMANGMGQITRAFGSTPLTPDEGVRLVKELQRRLIEDTRLGIPAIIHEECLTGFMAQGATAFPSPLNWGSTFDPRLIEEVGDAIRQQMRSVGAHQGLAPVLDVVRDPRWGRVEECIGEDPYLVGMIGSAYIRGLQGAVADGVAATAKHFAGHSFSEGGRNLAPAHLGPRELADVFLVPFEMAVRDGLQSVMNSYQENDGVPAAASRALLTDLLRGQWGFDGVVVSDYFSIAWLHALHGVAASNAEAAALALHAGIDIELPSPDCYTAPLLEAVASGLVGEDDVDRAVERVLRLKARLGLFAQPYADDTAPINLDPSPHRALARRVAERSIVLLKNDGAILPLAANLSTVALIGPNADAARAVLGNYSFANHVGAHFPDAPIGIDVVTIADGVRDNVSGSATVTVAPGCEVVGDDRSGFAAAVAAAESADVAIVVVGDNAGHFGSGTSGEGTDADDLSLPGVQEELVLAVAATRTPTVVVLVSGRPYAIGDIAEAVPAIVQAWFPGEEAGSAVADVLFGKVNPAGRTPVTFSRGAGQQPLFYNDKPLGRTGYARSSTRPVFPFGHGLSYTSFHYRDLIIEPIDVQLDGVVRISCVIQNEGTRRGDEVVQLYVRDPFASVTRPIQELKGFARLPLDPGASARVTFELSTDMLAYTDTELRKVVDPGRVDIMIGPSSAVTPLRGSFTVSGPGPRTTGPDRVLTTPVHLESLSG